MSVEATGEVAPSHPRRLQTLDGEFPIGQAGDVFVRPLARLRYPLDTRSGGHRCPPSPSEFTASAKNPAQRPCHPVGRAGSLRASDRRPPGPRRAHARRRLAPGAPGLGQPPCWGASEGHPHHAGRWCARPRPRWQVAGRIVAIERDLGCAVVGGGRWAVSVNNAHAGGHRGPSFATPSCAFSGALDGWRPARRLHRAEAAWPPTIWGRNLGGCGRGLRSRRQPRGIGQPWHRAHRALRGRTARARPGPAHPGPLADGLGRPARWRGGSAARLGRVQLSLFSDSRRHHGS